MKNPIKLALVISTASAVVLAGTITALANWTVPANTGKVSFRTVQMPRGLTPAVGKVGQDAVLTWFPQDIAPGTPMQSYIVTRHSVTDAGLIEEFPPTTATTFTDDGVGGGKWYWTIRPKFELWEGEEGRKSDRLTFPAIPAGQSALAADGPAGNSALSPAEDTAPVPADDAGTPTDSEPPAEKADPPVEPPAVPIEPPASDPPAPTDPLLESTVAPTVTEPT